jgi:hypothetical protein
MTEQKQAEHMTEQKQAEPTSADLFREARNKLSTGYCVLDPHFRKLLSALADLTEANKQPVTDQQQAFIAAKRIDRALEYVSDACAEFIGGIDMLRK